MRNRMDEIQQMVENAKQPYSKSPSTSFLVSENKHENYQTTSRGPNPLLPSKSNFQCPNLEPKTLSPHQTKPQCFEGSEDLDEYLAQFEILSELNRWDYHQKSLHLASSLKGNARAILSELSHVERRDYNHLIKALTTRFGSQGRAEIYRAQLQTRIRHRDETISELAQSIKKLTRHAYPEAPSSVTKILSLDHFVDAIPDSDMRLRIREAHPKDIDEAEAQAIRLETHRLADRQRCSNRPVRAINEKQPDQSSHSDTLNLIRDEFSQVRKDIGSLTNEIRKLNQSKFQRNQNNERSSQSQKTHGSYPNRQNKGQNGQKSGQSQGNGRQSYPGVTERQPQNGPQQFY